MCLPAQVQGSGLWLPALLVAWVGLAGVAGAQVSTATIQGTVSDDTGVLPGANVVARHVQSGFAHETVTAEDGTFTLPGLRPGQYNITVAFAQYKPQARTVEVLVGQSATVNFRVTPDVVYTENVTVVGDTRLLDTRESEVTTNVTREQIQYLPQNNRNFLNFAALAPGVRVSDNEFRKEFSSGALGSQNVNVFIDGVSFKNDVIDGGVVGQDASRGNPFPQNAVQEFQVLTQNFKAEYEKAASAIITAVTKSGGNRFSGELFNFYQDKALAQNETVRDVNGLLEVGEATPKPTYERWQWGASLGGPIVQDKMQFFASYEENRQDRDNTVIAGTISNAPAALIDRLRAFEGTFTSPFREKLLFGKLSMQPASAHQLEATYNWRDETDIRNFGGTTSFESAENVKNRVDSAQGKWQVAATSFFNEAYVSYQRYRWNPTAENPDIIGENFDGLLRIGGRDTDQHIVQQRFSVRNDHSRFLKWNGNHTVKGGGVFSYVDYDVTKLFTGNPIFTFVGNVSWDFPARAQFGVGDPDLSATNSQIGLFLQDDWAATNRLTLNLGLRWDYESDMLNNDYVTPENVRAGTASFVDNDRYFTDGDDRPPFYGMWQPRLGFSYDLLGKGQTIAFGGWGRYYDRVLYNSTLDERFRQQYAVRTFQFSATGAEIRDGVQTIAWNPSFLGVQGLQSLIASGRAPNPEVFLIANDTEPPVSDQWSLGVRHNFRGIVTSVTYTGMRARNLFTFIRGNRRPDGTCCESVPGFAAILISDPEGRKAWYDGLYIQADRPYGIGGSRYGFSITYTLGKAEETGGDLFSLDAPTAADYPRHPTSADERHRLVMTGIVGLPWDIIASTFITLGSGTPFTVTDESLGTTADLRRVLRNEGRPEQFGFIIPNAWAYRSVDVQVEKAFRFAQRHAFSVIFQGFNIFSYDNFMDFVGNIPTLPAVNPNFGRGRRLIDPGRRLQFGLRYAF
jgi:outer membrane receptor protein involved in Fe transport